MISETEKDAFSETAEKREHKRLKNSLMLSFFFLFMHPVRKISGSPLRHFPENPNRE